MAQTETVPETPVLLALHGLGLSGRAYDRVATELAGFDVVALDLPGFGDEPVEGGTQVDDVVDHVVARARAALDERGWPRWLLVGHSMGGKIATVLAARTLAGSVPLFGLAGVLLLAGSPPTPEPMPDDDREQMLAMVPFDDASAGAFLAANLGAPLPPELDALVRTDLRRTDPQAWRAWLRRGSREDWSTAVGTLDLPATILAGDADASLGPDVQRATNARVYPRADVQVLPGAGHLLMLERPVEVAAAVTDFWAGRAGLGPAVPGRHARTMAGRHTGARARGALAVRAVADDPARPPAALSADQLATLRAMADRVVPQDGVDLAARVDAQLSAGAGNGWRFDDLPPDGAAYRQALDALSDLTTLGADGQDDLLRRVAAGDGPAGALTPGQLQRWFEDAVDDLVRQWVAHPATQARLDFDGYASGGDGVRMQGYELLDAGTREAWEPTP